MSAPSASVPHAGAPPANPPRAFVAGHHIAHSRSPLLHGYWLETLGIDGTYGLVDIAPADFPDFLRGLRRNGYAGGNVTVPHKQAAFQTVARRDAAAEAIGAVNTVWYEDGVLVGGNTDAYGFLANLDATAPGWDDTRPTAVVLGAGGAARAAIHALRSRGLDVRVVNRSRDRAAGLADHFGVGVSAHDTAALPALLAQAGLLVNTTSLGMVGHPALDIDLTPLGARAVVYDIVYVPLETELLRAARARGLRTVDGLGMLLHQGVPGFARWFGVTPAVTPALRAVLEIDIRAKSG